jgi:hypothetical protein
MKPLLIVLLFGIVFLSSFGTVSAQNSSKPGKLAVLWTSGDIDVAERVCLMYTHAAKQNNWFDEVVLIVWGPSAKLLADNEELQKKVKSMASDGVKLQACIACANSYGVADKLKKMGIEVIGMGTPLTNYMKDGWHVLTF